MNYVLYNTLSNNKQGEKSADELIAKIGGAEKKSVIGIDYVEFLNGLTAKDNVYLVGGDGTLNIFVNAIYGQTFKPKIWFCPAGSGNDFINDVKDDEAYKDGIVDIMKFVKNLPTVYVNGMKRRFINGIGYGLDGVCCELGDIQRAKSDKPVNYSSIAIKLVLYKFKPRTAVVTVDGVEHIFEKVWIAPSMKGRYYGGGMKVAPRQDRFDPNNTLTFVAITSGSRLGLLMTFKKIFTGEHENKKCTNILTGKTITVKFNEPCALQIDGETVLNVTEYTVKA